MSSAARKAFIEGLAALETSINSPMVTGPDKVGSFLRRGLQVVAYGLLETFIMDRLNELSAHINGGISHVSDLPEKLQRAAFQDVLRIAADKMQWIGTDLPEVIAFSSALGSSLSASSGSIQLSPLTWQWRGSNMNAEDLARALKLFHVKSPWPTVSEICQRLGFPISDARVAAVNMLRERNSSAHDSTHQVSNLIARTAPTQLLGIGCTSDILMSIAAHCIHSGDQTFLQNSEWLTANQVKIRFVQRRSRDWAEILEGKNRAIRVNADQELAFKAACSAAMGRSEVVVLRDMAHKVIDWNFPDTP